MGTIIALMLLAATPDHMLIERPVVATIMEEPIRKLVPIPVILKAEDLEPTKPVLLVMFYSKWCEPCNAMKPVLRRLRDEGYAIQCLDVEDPKWKVYAERFNVRAVPYWVMFIDGMSWQTRKGNVSESVLRRWHLEAKQKQAGIIAVPPLVSIPVVRPVPQYRPMPVYRSAPVYQRAWGVTRGRWCAMCGVYH